MSQQGRVRSFLRRPSSAPRAGWSAGLFLVVSVVAPAPVAFAVEGEQLVKLEAINQQWVQDELWCGSGDVRIAYQDVKLRCDEMEVDLRSMHLSAAGNVVFDQGDTRFACDRVDFDLKNKIGTFYNVEAFFPPTYSFRGEEVDKLDETHYRFRRGLFTSCTLGDEAPPWSLEIREALLEVEGYGHFRGVALKVQGVPVFYTPRLLWPVKRDRAAGLLVPNIGYNNTRGAYLGNAFFWPVSRSFDTTFFLDTYSKGYLGLGEEFRWTPAENAGGELLLNTVRDADTNGWEWKVLGKYDQLFPGGYALKAEVNELSNLDFFQRFERTFDRNAMRTLYSYLTLSRTWGPQAFNVRADFRKTFFSTTAAATAVILERRPEAEYRLRSTRIGRTPLYVSLVAVADQFRINRSPTLRGMYGRFDLFPTVSVLTSGLPWLNVTPTFGFRETYYTSQYSEDRNYLVEEPLSRSYATAGLSVVGPSISRVWTKEGGSKVKHLVEPRVEYQYVSDPGDVSRIPVFDEKDSVQVTNRLRWTLANRLFLKRGEEAGREVATFEVAQEYSLSDPLTYERPGYPASKRGPLSFWLRAVPLQGANLDARADLDAVTNKLRSTSLSAGLFRSTGNVNLTWYTSYDPITGEATSSQTRVFFGIAPGKAPWRLETHLAYDLEKAALLEQRYTARWQGSCWSLYLEWRDYRIAPYKTRDYRIAIDLTGLGTFLDIHGRSGATGY